MSNSSKKMDFLSRENADSAPVRGVTFGEHDPIGHMTDEDYEWSIEADLRSRKARTSRPRRTVGNACML